MRLFPAPLLQVPAAQTCPPRPRPGRPPGCGTYAGCHLGPPTPPAPAWGVWQVPGRQARSGATPLSLKTTNFQSDPVQGSGRPAATARVRVPVVEARTRGPEHQGQRGGPSCWVGASRCLERPREGGPRPGGAGGWGWRQRVRVLGGGGWGRDTRSAGRGAVSGGVRMALLVQLGPAGSGWLWCPCRQRRPGPRGAQGTGRESSGLGRRWAALCLASDGRWAVCCGQLWGPRLAPSSLLQGGTLG